MFRLYLMVNQIVHVDTVLFCVAGLRWMYGLLKYDLWLFLYYADGQLIGLYVKIYK